jgi:hypothetical protein
MLVLASALVPTEVGAYGYTTAMRIVNGDSGHAFAYFQVTGAIGTSTAAVGSFDTPYYSVWHLIELQDPTCPWLWLIPIYERASGLQINPSRPGIGTYGVRDHLCAKPNLTPVATSRDLTARALLSLDLRVWSDPPTAPTRRPVTIHGALSDRIDNDLRMLLSMSIRSWEVASWHIAFGDGHRETYPGGSRAVQGTHAYALAGNFVATVTARITGLAEAAEYGAGGEPYVSNVPFSVDISNRSDTRATRVPVIRHIPPVLAVAAAPGGTGVDLPLAGFQHLEALRGRLTTLYPRVVVINSGYVTEDDLPVGGAITSLSTWQYLGGVNDAPPGSATPAQSTGTPQESISIQWNRPGPFREGRAQDYEIPLRLSVHTVFSDGAVLDAQLTGAVTVTVRYAAISH